MRTVRSDMPQKVNSSMAMSRYGERKDKWEKTECPSAPAMMATTRAHCLRKTRIRFMVLSERRSPADAGVSKYFSNHSRKSSAPATMRKKVKTSSASP